MMEAGEIGASCAPPLDPDGDASAQQRALESFGRAEVGLGAPA